MEQSDELSLWSANALLQASGHELQSFLVVDLQEQVEQGKSLADGMAKLSVSERQPGDFGMEIAGTLLAPVVVELLKEFWSAYVKKLSDDTGGALADATTSRLKAWFVSTLGKKDDNGALADLETRIDHLAANKKLSRKEADSLLEALRSPKLAHELATRK